MHAADDENTFEQLPDSRKEILLTWIAQTFKPIKSPNTNHSSYGLKHLFESATGKYITNGEFKGAMLHAGYLPTNPTHQNWYFRISEKSVPGIHILHEHLNLEPIRKRLEHYHTRWEGGNHRSQSERYSKFIVNAPIDITMLLAEVERLREALESINTLNTTVETMGARLAAAKEIAGQALEGVKDE